MSLKSVEVPEGLKEPFVHAEGLVEGQFKTFEREPEQGTIRVDGDRYVLVRCESLYATWFDALEASFGAQAASDFIYNTAREIGKSDAQAFAKRLNLDDPVQRLASGPVHFAHAGWARVVILEDSAPAPDETFFLHYRHPNTFEAEVIRNQGKQVDHCCCYFSAGYSAGWCSYAFGVEVHGREIHCTARGDEHCEFIMAPASALDAHVEQILNNA